jgi:hypothetical protein
LPCRRNGHPVELIEPAQTNHHAGFRQIPEVSVHPSFRFKINSGLAVMLRRLFTIEMEEYRLSKNGSG